jgi:response regulator RpfG family c-di-GMP phosphodiesterase
LTDKILFVDDDSNLLASYKRQLRKQFVIETASEGKLGLEAITDQGPYAVVVSDLRMPGMDGIQFLCRVREISPDSVRMMLTGYADVKTAIEAVNEGNIFRFLTKPCHPDDLFKALIAGMHQYRLITAERELLEKTLNGSIRMLSEVLSLLNPEAFGRTSRVARYVKEIALEMGLPKVWQFETATVLSQVGCIIFPQDVLKKIYRGEELTEKESQLLDTHPAIASHLVAHIPRMEEIVEIIAYQGKRFDGSAVPSDSRKGEQIPLGARILKVVLDFDTLEISRNSKDALLQLKQRSGWYDPRVLSALEAVMVTEAEYLMRAVTPRELEAGMIFAEDVRTVNGVLLISKGHEVSKPLLERLMNIGMTSGIQEPIQVLIPPRRKREPLHRNSIDRGGKEDAV